MKTALDLFNKLQETTPVLSTIAHYCDAVLLIVCAPIAACYTACAVKCKQHSRPWRSCTLGYVLVVLIFYYVTHLHTPHKGSQTFAYTLQRTLTRGLRHMTKHYHPNTSDKRVQKRIRNALGFTLGVLSDEPHQWGTRYLDKYLGRQDTDIGKWLRGHLVVVSNNRYNKDTGECKEYCINHDGVRYLRDIVAGNTSQTFKEWDVYRCQRHSCDMQDVLDMEDTTNKIATPNTYPSVHDLHIDDRELIIEWTQDMFAGELFTLEFLYEDKSNRLWHPLQQVRKHHKKSIFKDIGLVYQYDIECCAPTLIHQYAQMQGMDLYLFELREYLRDRSKLRKQIAKEVGIREDTAKKIINALFAGAQLGHNPGSAIYAMLKKDHNKIDKLQALAFVQDLRKDIALCWEYIKPTLPRKSQKDKNGKDRMLPVTSKQKWGVYFDQERKILNVVRKYLEATKNKYFLEHDGWSTQTRIDIDALELHILLETGFAVKLEEVIL